MQAEIVFPNLGIEIQKLDPVAFSIFGMPIYWYGVLIGVGLMLAIWVGLKEIKRTGQDADTYLDYLVYGIIFSFICARIYYVIFSWDYYKDNLIKIFAIREGGIAIYGGIIGAVISIYVYTRIKEISFFKFTDTCAPSLLVGQIIGRFGNFVNREAFGGNTDSLFAMRYLKTQVSGVSEEILNYLPNSPYIQVHPTFLYEALWNLCVFIFLTIYKKHKKFEGELTALYFLCYGLGRFWIEGLRIDQLKIGHTNIAVSQVLSVIFVVISASVFIYKRLKGDKHEESK